MQIIDYKNVELCHDEIIVLHDINFSVDEGEFIYLCGKTGSGKSSLLKSLYADMPIKRGEARIFDYDLSKLSRRQIPFLRRKIGVIFQDFQLLHDRSVRDNLEFVLSHRVEGSPTDRRPDRPCTQYCRASEERLQTPSSTLRRRAATYRNSAVASELASADCSRRAYR